MNRVLIYRLLFTGSNYFIFGTLTEYLCKIIDVKFSTFCKIYNQLIDA